MEVRPKRRAGGLNRRKNNFEQLLQLNPAEQQHLKFPPLRPGEGGNLNDVAAEQGKRGAKF